MKKIWSKVLKNWELKTTPITIKTTVLSIKYLMCVYGSCTIALKHLKHLHNLHLKTIKKHDIGNKKGLEAAIKEE